MNEQLKIIISAEIDKLKRGVADAKKQVEQFTEGSEKGASKMDKAFESVGNTLRNGLKQGAAIATAAFAAVTAAIVGVVSGTEEYRNSMAQLTTAYETAGSSAEQAKKTYSDLYRVLGETDTAVEASNLLAKMTTNEKELSEWTTILTGVYAQFPDSLPLEGLAEASNETAKVGKVTGVLADAINWASVSNEEFSATLGGNAKAQKVFNDALAEGMTREDAFNEALASLNTEAEREALIRESLNSLYSESAATFEKNNEKVLAQRDAQAKLQETLARVAEAVAPVVTAFTELANDALAAAEPYIIGFAENYLPAIQEALGGLGDILGNIIGFISENIVLFGVLAGLYTTITIAVTAYNAVAAIKAAMAALEVTSVWGLVSAYAAQAAAMIAAIAPYVLIVAAIAAVIAIIVLCIKYWDEIKEVVAKVATAIWEKVKEMKDKVVEFFTQLWTSIVEKVTAIKDAIVAKFVEIKTNVLNKVAEMKQAVVNKFLEIKTGIETKIAEAKQAVVDKFNQMKSDAVTKAQEIFSAVTGKFAEIKTNIENKIQSARDTVRGVFDEIKSFVDFEWSLPKLKLPTVSISGKFSLNPVQVPKFSINWNALGGVFDKPTLFSYGDSLQGIGEDGAEAVVPLEKNTQWLDKIAERLRGKATPVYLQVDGKTLGQVTIDSINNLTMQTGNLPLKFA